MPGFDGTGPAGQGPMTGRQMGNCVSKNTSNAEKPIRQGFGTGTRFGFFGPGLGLRRGRGGCSRGFRSHFSSPNQAIPAMNQNEQLDQLQMRVEELKAELAAVRQQNENSDNQR